MKVVRYLVKLVTASMILSASIFSVILIILNLSTSLGIAILGGMIIFVVLFIFIVPYLFHQEIDDINQRELENEKKKQSENDTTSPIS